MRALLISGAILVAIGIWFIVRPPTYSREESVLRFGGFEATMRQERPVPGWVGGIVLGVGLVLVVASAAKR